MNKKQAVIIVSLLVLIICAGVLATNLNTSLYVNNQDSDIGKDTISTNNSKTVKKSNYFAEAKLTRNASHDKTLETLKTIINDKNAPAENKKTASQKYTNIAVDGHNEIKIEEALKGNGFKDALCLIENGKAKVYVEANAKLNDEQCRKIQQVVLNISKIRDIDIKTKQQ